MIRREIMFEEIKDTLIKQLDLDPETITPDAELVNDLGVNSIELADLVLLCEDKYDIEIDDDDIKNFITVGDVADYLAKATS